MPTTIPSFVRARSAEQRAERRAAILATAAEMLAEGRVAELTLNELARRVGLAKSNVLRYFETREAVLLALLQQQYDAWLDALEEALATPVAPVPPEPAEPIERVAVAVADTIAARPVLSELLASAQTVLEHNVSGEVAAAYKRSAVASAERLVEVIADGLAASAPGGSPLAAPAAMPVDAASFVVASRSAGVALAGAVNLVIGGAWGMCRPSPGMLAAYDAHPELAELQLDYRVAVRELVATVLTGLAHRPVGEGL